MDLLDLVWSEKFESVRKVWFQGDLAGYVLVR